MKPFPEELSEKELIPDFKTSSFPNNKPIPILAFIVPLVIQAGLLFAIPAQSAYVPVDPYS